MVFGLAVMMPAAALADEGDSDGSAPTDPSAYNDSFPLSDKNIPENPDDPPKLLFYSGGSKSNGMLVSTENGHTGNFEVTPSVKAADYALHVTSDAEGSVSTVQVDGLVTSGKDALSVTATNQGSVIVTAQAVDSTATGDGVDIDASGGSKVDISTGSITAGGTGVSVLASEASKVKVNAGGAVKAGQDGVYILADGDGTEVAVFAMDEVNAKNEGVDIEASDGATAGGIVGKVTSSDENAFGVWIRAEDDSSAGSSAVSIPDISSISVDPEAGKWPTVPTASSTDSSSAATVSLIAGDVTAYAGIHVEANGAVAGLETDKVTATNGNIHDQDGVLDRFANEFIATNKGLVTGTLGDVESGENGCGISVYVYEGGVATVNAENIQAGEIGVHIDNEGGTTWTDVGNITSGDEGIGLTLVGGDAVSIAFADGNVTSDGDNGISISNDGGHTMVCVSGDASSTATDRAGLRFYGSGETLVLVAGTLSGADGVKIDDNTKAEDLDLTVWTIKANDGDIIAGDDAKGTFAKSISYIVLVEQPVAGGKLTAVQADGKTALNKKYDDQGSGGFEVASQTQKIYLKVKADKGYKLVGAYNGMENRKALMKDENGYYLEVPIGGGIYLTAVLKLDEHGNVVVQNAGRTRKAVISLDPAGGTMTGKTEFSKAIGSTFMFTEEPVWEGHSFLYWESTAHPGLQYKTGDRFIVEESDTFVAVWA